MKWHENYELVGNPLSAEGGGALVQKARGVSEPNEEVIIKIASDEHRRPRFEREIEVGLSLSHPNVMPVLDSNLDGLWFTMPVADGRAIEANPNIPAEVLLGQLRALCAGLEAGHGAGYLHRDLKPDNLLQLDGRLVVADWGLARNPPGSTASNKPTVTGLPYGSWGWAAPELTGSAHEAGPAADVYSIGQLIGWVLTGEEPNQGVPLVPENAGWASVVEACTALDPSTRPQTPSALLDLVLDSVQIHADEDLLSELYQLADAGHARLPKRVERRRMEGHSFFEVDWYPAAAKPTIYVNGFPAYKAFIERFPGELANSFEGNPPDPVASWPTSRLAAALEAARQRSS